LAHRRNRRERAEGATEILDHRSGAERQGEDRHPHRRNMVGSLRQPFGRGAAERGFIDHVILPKPAAASPAPSPRSGEEGRDAGQEARQHPAVR